MTATIEELEVGTKVPYFTSVDQDGDTFTSEDLAGMPYVIYFYPKDETPGCTIEACDFNEKLEEIEELGITVVGVSRDSVKSHQNFCKNHNLDFTLLADETGEVCHKFGVIKEDGQLERTTFIVDCNSTIQWMERPVEVKGHAKRVLEALEELELD